MSKKFKLFLFYWLLIGIGVFACSLLFFYKIPMFAIGISLQLTAIIGPIFAPCFVKIHEGFLDDVNELIEIYKARKK